MTRKWLLGLAVLIVMTGCGSAHQPSPRIVDVEVVDSAVAAEVWNPMAEGTATYSVAVTTEMGADTIGMVIPPLPIIAGDTAVVGVWLVPGEEGDAEREIFSYRWAKAMKRWPVPEDTYWVFHDLAVSPSGRYLAYVAMDDRYATLAAVNDLETGERVVEGAGRGGCDCDVDRNHARWVAPDSFEIAVALSNSTGGWEIVSGSASARRFHTDTVSSEPVWHGER